MDTSKSFKISKRLIWNAFKRVRANQGSSGVDHIEIDEFEKDLKSNLYKLWNRMSSGSYFPAAVRLVEIPKKSGGIRGLGIPTVEDRVAQMAVKSILEPQLDPLFHENSYGYRPHKSAIQAIGQARKRCWQYDFVIDLDIKGLFDHIDHELLMKAVRKHTQTKWILLYIQRWLKAPIQKENGICIPRLAGVPQGGVISPILANLFMHYAFDRWMDIHFAGIPFERYADDVIVHTRTETEAVRALSALKERFGTCHLELHPTKTKIVYCKDKDRRADYPNTEFDFLGYTFRRLFIKDRLGRLRFNFLPAVSRKSCVNFRHKIKEMRLHKYVGLKVEQMAEMINPSVRGWLNYFMKFCPSMVSYTMACINRRLIKWAMCKFKHLRGRSQRATQWLKGLAQREPKLFAHWALGWKP